jgi:hypothetical protein
VSDGALTNDVCDKPPFSELGKRASAAWRRPPCDSAAAHSSWLVLGMLTVLRISAAPVPTHVPRIGVLSHFAPAAGSSVAFEGFRAGLRALGYTERRNGLCRKCLFMSFFGSVSG